MKGLRAIKKKNLCRCENQDKSFWGDVCILLELYIIQKQPSRGIL